MNFTQFVKNYVERNPGTKYSSALKDIDVKCLWRDYKNKKARTPTLSRGNIRPPSAFSATPMGEMLMLNRALNVDYQNQQQPNNLFQIMNAPRQAVERRTMGTMTDDILNADTDDDSDDGSEYLRGFRYRNIYDYDTDDDIIVDARNPMLDAGQPEAKEEQVPSFERPNIQGNYSLFDLLPDDIPRLGPGVTLPQYQQGFGLKRMKRAYNYGTGMRRNRRR